MSNDVIRGQNQLFRHYMTSFLSHQLFFMSLKIYIPLSGQPRTLAKRVSYLLLTSVPCRGCQKTVAARKIPATKVHAYLTMNLITTSAQITVDFKDYDIVPSRTIAVNTLQTSEQYTSMICRYLALKAISRILLATLTRKILVHSLTLT